MNEKKVYIEPELSKSGEKLDELTMGGPPLGSPPEDLGLPEDS